MSSLLLADRVGVDSVSEGLERPCPHLRFSLPEVIRQWEDLSR